MTMSFEWLHQPQEVEDAYAAYQANDHNDMASFETWYRPYSDLRDKHGCYLDWSFGWVKRLMDHMQSASMVYGAYQDQPDGFRTICQSTFCGLEPDGRPPTTIPTCCATDTAYYTALTELGPHPEQGIPLYKFSSNDSWVIYPEEITAALQAYEDAGRPPFPTDNTWDTKYWAAWIRFLYCARGWGGIVIG